MRSTASPTLIPTSNSATNGPHTSGQRFLKQWFGRDGQGSRRLVFALMACLAACGEPTMPLSDGGTASPDTGAADAIGIDGGIADGAVTDAGPADAAADGGAGADAGSPVDASVPDEVVVVVTAQGYGGEATTRVEGAPVFFHDEQGGLLHSAVTDDAGEARFELPANGMVTVQGPDRSTGLSLETRTNVQAPETLAFDDLYWNFPDARQISVSMDSYPTATNYVVSTGCESVNARGVLSRMMFVSPMCETEDSLHEVFAVAFDGSGNTLAYTLDLGVPAGADATVLGPWRTDFQPVSFTWQGRLPDAGEVEVEAQMRLASGYHDLSSVERQAPIVGRARLQHPRVPVIGYNYVFAMFTDDGLGASWVSVETSSVPAAVHVDVAQELLPFPRNVLMDLQMPARPRFVYEAPLDLAGNADFAQVLMVWTGDVRVSWNLFAPALPAGAPRFPQLPPGLQPVDPQGIVMFRDLDSVQSWAQLRQQGLGFNFRGRSSYRFGRYAQTQLKRW